MTYYMFIYVLGVAVFLLAVRLYLAVESWVSANGETPDRPDWLPVELTALFALGMMPGAQLLYACFHEGKSNGLWGGYAVFAGLLLPYLLLRKVSREAVLDSVALAVPAGLAVAKLACLYAGCCHGAETSVGWALRHDSSLIAPRGVPLHPTQLYDAGVFFATGVTVTALTACSVLRGRLVLVATAMMGIGRLTTGFFRGDTPPALGALSVAQWVALACALAAIAALVVPALRNAWAYVVVSEGGPEPDAWIHETQGSGAFAQAAGTYAAILFAPLAALYLAIRALSLLVAGGTGGGALACRRACGRLLVAPADERRDSRFGAGDSIAVGLAGQDGGGAFQLRRERPSARRGGCRRLRQCLRRLLRRDRRVAPPRDRHDPAHPTRAQRRVTSRLRITPP